MQMQRAGSERVWLGLSCLLTSVITLRGSDHTLQPEHTLGNPHVLPFPQILGTGFLCTHLQARESYSRKPRVLPRHPWAPFCPAVINSVALALVPQHWTVTGPALIIPGDSSAV